MNSKPDKPVIPRTDTIPTDGYVLAVDGKLKTKFTASEEAAAAALKLKQAYPVLHLLSPRTLALPTISASSVEPEAAATHDKE